MKNLKRVLSLGLASVMLLGMMVMGASAKDFTDAEKIVNGEAVQVLVALKVVNGKEDGSYFDPEGTVTRGEMAKMIAVAMNGGSEANTGVKGTPSYTDIGGHWAEGWIEYCADMGIINGRGDGTFDPNGLVTGTEALKMVLTALGYDAAAYHLQGASWAAQTLENARKTGNVKLTEGLDNIVMTQPATRDTAAQMIWNGLQAYTVDISPDKNTSSGETTWGYKETTTTMLELRYAAKVETGIFAGNADYKDGGSPASDEISVAYQVPSTDANGVVTYSTRYWCFPADIDIDYIGEEVKVVWKDGAKSTNKNAPDKNDTIFGVFLTGATRVERTILGKVKDNKNSKAQINLNGTVCDVADSVDVVYNYNTSTTYKKANGTGKAVNGVEGKDETARNSAENSGLTEALKKKTGDTVKAVFDDNGKVSKIYVTETKIASVSSVNSTNVTMNNGVGTAKIADHDVEEGLKKGDVVVVTTLYGAKPANAGAKATIKKAEKVSGEVEDYTLNDDHNKVSSITLSGKTYNTYKQDNLIVVEDTDKYVDVWDATTANSQIGKDFDLYLVNGYVGAAVRTSADASNYSVITEVKTGTAGAVFSGLQLQVMGADGTKEVISVSKDSSETAGVGTHVVGNGITDADYMVGDIITYSFDKNDLAEVEVWGKVGAAPTAGIKYNDNTKLVDGTVTVADCVFYGQVDAAGSVNAAGANNANSKADWEAYNIRDLGSITLASGAAYTIAKNTDGKVVAVFMDLKVIPDGASDDAVYGVISSANKRVDGYYSYTVQSNGETYEIKSKNTNLKKGTLVKFRPTADNTYGANAIKMYAAAAGDNKIVIGASNIGYVDEFSTRDNTLTYVYGGNVATDSDGNYTDDSGLSKKTYALAKDAVIVYVDVNGSKSEAEGSVDHWSEYTGRKNVMFTTKIVDNEEVIDVMFVETSTRADVNKNVK